MKTKFLVVGDKKGAPYCEFYAYCDDKLVFHTRGTVGRNGVSEDRVEGDGTTPIGTFKMGKCFGLLPVPESIKMDLGDGKETEVRMQMPYKVLDENEEEIDLKQTFEDDDDIIPPPVSDADDMDAIVEEGDFDDGFSLEDSDDDDYGDFDSDDDDEDYSFDDDDDLV